MDTSKDIRLGALTPSVFRLPTDALESDGTLTWDETTLIVIEVPAGGKRGIGYAYAPAAAASLVADTLSNLVYGRSALDISANWQRMVDAVRNMGRPGIASGAISAVDTALWDLKAKLLDLPLVSLLGAARDEIAVYGSGGFTSYDDKRLAEQLGRWAEQDGCRAVKMKVGSEPDRDPARMKAARNAIGDAELYIDANGALTPKEAIRMAERGAECGVTWFEEPVSSDDLDGLRFVRERTRGGMDVAAGEYGHTPHYFKQMLGAGAVDVLQVDATRCGGVTGFMRAAALADAFMCPVSAHTAPSLHLHVGCAAPRMKNIEWFHDHVRIEQMLFDGAPEIGNGVIRPDLTRPGLGLELKRADALRFAA